MHTRTEAVTAAATQPGRRPPRNGRSTPVGVRIPNPLLAELRQLAAERETSLSVVIVNAARRGLEAS